MKDNQDNPQAVDPDASGPPKASIAYAAAILRDVAALEQPRQVPPVAPLDRDTLLAAASIIEGLSGPKIRVVPASELSSRTLLARSYVDSIRPPPQLTAAPESRGFLMEVAWLSTYASQLYEVACAMRAERDDARVERDRMRAVVDAARAWDESPGDHGLCLALSDAVLAWRIAEESGEPPPESMCGECLEAEQARCTALSDELERLRAVVLDAGDVLAGYIRERDGLRADRDDVARERDEALAERDAVQRAAAWLPGEGEPLTAEALRGIKMRWSTGPDDYQADADALIGAVLSLTVERDDARKHRAEARALLRRESDRADRNAVEVQRLRAGLREVRQRLAECAEGLADEAAERALLDGDADA